MKEITDTGETEENRSGSTAPVAAPRFVLGSATTGGLCLRLWPVFALIALGIYWQALRGPFISDDLMYVALNPWAQSLSLESVKEMFHPFGEIRVQGANYAPLHHLSTGLELAVFWDNPIGFHVVNVLIHALNATLLVALLATTGLPMTLAFVGGLLFLIHPGNVEAVAWISQLKTSGSLALTFGCLLALRRHPGWATLLFAAALLTKASGAVALPMGAALVWVRGGDRAGMKSTWAWFALWLGLFLLYSIPQMDVMDPRGLVVVPAYEDLGVHLRTIASIGTHYLVMAYTTLGLSHTHEHPPVFSILDPWWLAAIPLTVFFLWRIILSLRQKTMESVYWLGAAAAFAPIAQWLPFSHPIADRYLYFILPGLIGGSLFLVRDFAESWLRRRSDTASVESASVEPPVRGPEWPLALRRTAMALTIVIGLVLVVMSSQRASLWTDQTLLSLNSARHYPQGRSALMLKARQAAQTGDADRAMEHLRGAVALGRDNFHPLVLDQTFEPIAETPAFQQLIFELAKRYIELVATYDQIYASDLGSLSVAYFHIGELDQALRSLEEAVALGGPKAEMFVTELESLRAFKAELDRDRFRWAPGAAAVDPSAVD